MWIVIVTVSEPCEWLSEGVWCHVVVKFMVLYYILIVFMIFYGFFTIFMVFSQFLLIQTLSSNTSSLSISASDNINL